MVNCFILGLVFQYLLHTFVYRDALDFCYYYYCIFIMTMMILIIIILMIVYLCMIFRSGQSVKDENESESLRFSKEDWERLNQIIGYKEGEYGQSLIADDHGDVFHTSLEVHMNHNASKLLADAQECLAELSCESLDCSFSLYSVAKVFNMKLGSYRLSSPNGLLAEV